MTAPNAQSTSRSLEIVTVCYTPELNFLLLQARSISRHLDPTGIDRIWVVLNEEAPAFAAGYFEREIAPEYGVHAKNVAVIEARTLIPDLFDNKIRPSARGWRTQQALKLEIASLVQAESYLILDAKNHLIKHANSGSFFDKNRRYRGFQSRHRRGDRHEIEFRKSYSYFGLDPEAYLDRAPATITPVGLRTVLVRELLETIRKRENMTFSQFFLGPQAANYTEFLLAQAYLVATAATYERDFSFGARNTATLFRGKDDVGARVQRMLKLIQDERVLTMGLHRSVLHELTDSQRSEIAGVWHDAGLLASDSDVDFFTKPFFPDQPA